MRGAYLVPTCGGQANGDQWPLDILKNAIVKPRWRQFVALIKEIPRQMPLNSDAERRRLFGVARVNQLRRLSQFAGDGACWNLVAGMQDREASDQVLELAHVSRPTVVLEHVERLDIEMLGRQALSFGFVQKVA